MKRSFFMVARMSAMRTLIDVFTHAHLTTISAHLGAELHAHTVAHAYADAYLGPGARRSHCHTRTYTSTSCHGVPCFRHVGLIQCCAARHVTCTLNNLSTRGAQVSVSTGAPSVMIHHASLTSSSIFIHYCACAKICASLSPICHTGHECSQRVESTDDLLLGSVFLTLSSSVCRPAY